MSKYNITMKQKNGSDYDELYPESPVKYFISLL